jgi:hypothetical protein
VLLLVSGLPAGPLACSSTQSTPPEAPQYPALVLPLPSSSAEPNAGKKAPGAASSGDALPRRTGTSDLPDPDATLSATQWRYQLLYDHGELRVQKVQAICLSQPQASARKLGRFAFELWLGAELVDRIRFDFPLLAGEEPVPAGSARNRPPSFAPGARVSTSILVPANPRATRAHILDRSTGQRVPVPWPPAGVGQADQSCAAVVPSPGSARP